MPSFAASWESLLVFLVIVLLSGLSNWLKQRQEKRQQAEGQEKRGLAPGEPAVPPPLHPPREPEAADWEKELRRLFGEEPEPPPPPPRPVAPPPLVRPSPVFPSGPPEPILPRTFKGPAMEPESAPRPIARPLGTPLAPVPEALEAEEQPEFVWTAPAELASATHGGIHAREAAVVRPQGGLISAEHVLPATTRARERHTSREIARVRAQLRQPRTAREVILATVMLGPPRALEPSQ